MTGPQILRDLHAALQARGHALRGIGLGHREKSGQLQGDLAVKLVVERKRRRLPGGTRLPRRVRVQTRVLGQPVGFWIPTDVVEIPRLVPTSLNVDGMRAAALASWTVDGARRYGAVTAAHGLPAVGEAVTVGSAAGTVVLRADLASVGLDVGLVDVGSDPAALADVGNQALPLADDATLLQLLGHFGDGGNDFVGESWGVAPEVAAFVAHAFYSAIDVALEGGGRITLREALYVQSLDHTLTPGTSGSAWISVLAAPAVNYALAIQSHANDDGPRYTYGYGTRLGAAVDWLRGQAGFGDLRVAFRIRDL